MNLRFVFSLCLVLMVPAARGRGPSQPNPSVAVSDVPDKGKISYALGMNLGLQRQHVASRVDISAFTQALKDVLEGKPTQVKEAEVAELLNSEKEQVLAGQTKPAEPGKPDSGEADPRLGYALGMRMGGQLKRVHADVDAEVVAEGLKDMQEGTPTKIQQSEIQPLFERAQAYTEAEQTRKNKSEGEVFLARNVKEPGVQVLPDGLQYRVVQAGTGPAPSTNDLIFIKYRGKLVNGIEFDHSEHYLTRTTGGIAGWQEALQRMKVGSRWQIFVPSELGFGHEGEAARGIGPDTALIYDMELVSIAKPGDPLIGTGTIGHGLEGELSAQKDFK